MLITDNSAKLQKELLDGRVDLSNHGPSVAYSLCFNFKGPEITIEANDASL